MARVVHFGLICKGRFSHLLSDGRHVLSIFGSSDGHGEPRVTRRTVTIYDPTLYIRNDMKRLQLLHDDIDINYYYNINYGGLKRSGYMYGG